MITFFKGEKNDPNLPGLLITVNLLFNFGSLVLFNFDSHTHI